MNKQAVPLGGGGDLDAELSGLVLQVALLLFLVPAKLQGDFIRRAIDV